MSRPKRYTDSELLESASEIEDEYPKVAEGLGIIATEEEVDISSNSENLSELEQALFQIVTDTGELLTPDDYAYRIEHRHEELGDEFPELTSEETVEELLDNLVQKQYIGRSVTPNTSDTRLYGSFDAVLPRIEIGDANTHDNPGFRWKPKFLVEGADHLEIDITELVIRVHQHPRQGLHLPPIENHR